MGHGEPEGDGTMRKNVGKWNEEGEGETNQGGGQTMKHGNQGEWGRWARSSMAIVGAGDGDGEERIFLGFRWGRDECVDCGRVGLGR